MAFPRPPVGSVTTEQCHPTVALKKVYSPLADISGSAPLAANYPLLHDAEYDIGIHSIKLIYQATSPNTASTGNIIGITGDTNAVVEAFTAGTSGTHDQGVVQSLTLATTLNRAYHKAGNGPVLAKGVPLIANMTQGASNAGDYVIEVTYWLITPGV